MKKAFLLMAMMLTLSAPAWAQTDDTMATDTSAATDSATTEAPAAKGEHAKAKAEIRKEKRAAMHKARKETRKDRHAKMKSKVEEKAGSTTSEEPATTGAAE